MPRPAPTESLLMEVQAICRDIEDLTRKIEQHNKLKSRAHRALLKASPAEREVILRALIDERPIQLVAKWNRRVTQLHKLSEQLRARANSGK